MRILIVEDDKIYQKMLNKILSSYGKCDIVSNGKEGLDAFLRAWEEGDPYLLITLDIMMPEMDGQEVLTQIREIEKKKAISSHQAKIIIISALDHTQNIIYSFRSGCESYIIKPVSEKGIKDALVDLGLIDKKDGVKDECSE
ncbi:MAG: response regulator [bacterium]